MKHTSITIIFVTIAILLGGCTQAGVNATQATAQAVSSSAAAGQTEAALSLTQTASIPPPSETPLPTPTALPTQTATSLPTETPTSRPTETAIPTETPIPTATPYVSIFDTMSDEEIVAIYENMPDPHGYNVKKYGWSTEATGKGNRLYHRVILTGKVNTFVYKNVEIDTVEAIFVDFDEANNPIIRKAWIAVGYTVLSDENGYTKGYYPTYGYHCIRTATNLEFDISNEDTWRQDFFDTVSNKILYAFIYFDYQYGGNLDANTLWFSFDQIAVDPTFGSYRPDLCPLYASCITTRLLWANYELDSGGVVNYFLSIHRGSPSIPDPIITGSLVMLVDFITP